MENNTKGKRNYVRKTPGKIDIIKNEFDNAGKLLDTFVKLYGEEDGIKMLKPHMEYMMNKINSLMNEDQME